MKIVMLGTFGLPSGQPEPSRSVIKSGAEPATAKSTMALRALPMAKALVDRGHRVTLILPPIYTPQEADSTRWGDGVEVVHVPAFDGPGPLRHLRIIEAMLNRVHDYGPAILHVFKPKGYGAAVGKFLTSLSSLSRRKLHLVVDADDWEGVGGWNEKMDYTGLERFVFAYQEGSSFKQAEAITVASRYLEHRLSQRPGWEDKIYYVPNGPDLSAQRFRADPGPAMNAAEALRVKIFGQHHSPPVVTLYTRFREFRIDWLLEVFKQILVNAPEARFVVIGEGRSSEQEEFRTMLETHDLSDLCIFTGWLPREEVWAYLLITTVAIFPLEPSIISEAKCSCRLIDHMVAGNAVVASAVGQNVEYIVDGATGVLVPSNTPHEFAAAVCDLLADRERISMFSAAAKERIWQAFDWDRLVPIVEQAYRRTST